MQVVAYQMGFYGGRRIRAGEEFEVADGDSGSWFGPVGEAPPKAKPARKSREPRTFAEIAKGPQAPADQH